VKQEAFWNVERTDGKDGWARGREKPFSFTVFAIGSPNSPIKNESEQHGKDNVILL